MVNRERPVMIRPGFFGVEAAADRRRNEFDFHNEALLYYRQLTAEFAVHSQNYVQEHVVLQRALSKQR